jgi:hypothetical protein
LYVLTKINIPQKTAYFETKFKDVSPTIRLRKTSVSALYILSQRAQNYAPARRGQKLFCLDFSRLVSLIRISELGPRCHLCPRIIRCAAWPGCE